RCTRIWVAKCLPSCPRLAIVSRLRLRRAVCCGLRFGWVKQAWLKVWLWGPLRSSSMKRPGCSWFRLRRDVNLRGREQAALVSNTDGGHATLGFELVAGILNMEVNGTLGYAKNHSDFPTCFSH